MPCDTSLNDATLMIVINFCLSLLLTSLRLLLLLLLLRTKQDPCDFFLNAVLDEQSAHGGSPTVSACPVWPVEAVPWCVTWNGVSNIEEVSSCCLLSLSLASEW